MTEIDLTKLYEWYRNYKRELPFRASTHFYSVWISETMLQQTRVEAMLPLYERFMRQFPDVNKLAQADVEDVLAHWQGLGYYNRARNLHQAARQIVQYHQGRFPAALDQALALAGVGPYTAAAVLSICYGQALAVLDGNVRRVLSRLFYPALAGASQQQLADRAQQLLNTQRSQSAYPGSGDHNQALMELGARVCLASTPSCEQCPLNVMCGLYQTGDPGLATQVPPKKRQSFTNVYLEIFIFKSDEGYFLIQDQDSFFFKRQLFFANQVWMQWECRYQSPGLERLRQGCTPFRSISYFRHAITKYKIEAHVLTADLLDLDLHLNSLQIEKAHWQLLSAQRIQSNVWSSMVAKCGLF